MTNKIIWQQGSNDPSNPDNLSLIRQWWTNLNGLSITFKQRMLPLGMNATELDWEPQRFDEKLMITNPELRGITLYWIGSNNPKMERSITPAKLELDARRDQLYIHSQAHSDLVYQIALPEVQYDMIRLENPEFDITKSGSNYKVIFKDHTKLVSAEIIMTADNLKQFLSQL